jgi:DNA repair exonuclease SbcCD ATPase subunit
LAAASLVAESGQAVASLVIEEPFDRLDAEAGFRTLALLRTLLEQIPRIVLVSRGDAVDARPELFDAVFEVRDDAGSGSAALRPAAAGDGSIFLGETARPPRGALPRR